MIIKHFFAWFINLLMDQRGEIGDLDTDDDTAPEDDKDKAKKNEGDSDDELGEITIKPEEEKSEEEKEKAKKEAENEKADDALKKELDQLKQDHAKLQTHKTGLEKALHEARQEKKKAKIEEETEVLTDTQLLKILEDNPDDPEIQLRMLKHLAQQVAKGEVDKGVSAAEINRKQAQFTDFLEDKYPTLFEEGSDIRRDVETTKKDLGLVDHPFGDFFAVAVNVLTDLPELMDYAFNEGKDAGLKGKTEEKRKEGIEHSKLPSSKGKAKGEEGLSDSALETAKQMELTPGQRKAYEKLVGKKPRIITVED